METIDRQKLLGTYGQFTWMFGQHFFVETESGNFIWSDPSYNGDNTFKFTELTYDQYVQSEYPEGYFGRDKGLHEIERYCGNEINLII